MRSEWHQILALTGLTTLDLLSKAVVFLRSDFGRPVEVIPGFFSIFPSLNRGVTWGLGGGMAYGNTLFIVVMVGMLAVLARFWWQARKQGHGFQAWCLLVVAAGALGNLWDRLWWGGVRDFLLCHYQYRWTWPTFNVADVYICGGAALLAWSMFREGRREAKDGRTPAR